MVQNKILERFQILSEVETTRDQSHSRIKDCPTREKYGRKKTMEWEKTSNPSEKIEKDGVWNIDVCLWTITLLKQSSRATF